MVCIVLKIRMQYIIWVYFVYCIEFNAFSHVIEQLRFVKLGNVCEWIY